MDHLHACAVTVLPWLKNKQQTFGYRFCNTWIPSYLFTWSFNRCSTWCWHWNPWPSHWEHTRKGHKAFLSFSSINLPKHPLAMEKRKLRHSKSVNLTQSKALHMTSQFSPPPCQPSEPTTMHPAWTPNGSASNLLDSRKQFFLGRYFVEAGWRES